MKRLNIFFALSFLSLIPLASPAEAQTEGRQSSSAIVKRRAEQDAAAAQGSSSSRVTDRMQQRFDNSSGVGDADKAWMKVIYRQLDLDKAPNTPLYYPTDIVDGEENLFRIIMRLLMDNQIKAYEFLDGREVFEDKYRLSVRDMLDRCYIAYTEAKGSTEKNPRFVADEADIPAAEVLRYFVIEQWEFDRRNNRLQNNILAICPVLMRSGEYTSEPEPMPLFWVKYADLRPHLMTRSVFLSDDNNLPTGTYDDFFTLNRYQGDIYKTRNLRNLSMNQMYPDPEDRRRAQDSIQATLDNFDAKLWVPSLDQLAQAREGGNEAATDSVAAADGPKDATRSRSSRAATRKAQSKPKARAKKEPKAKPAASSSAARSVRNRKK